jgi:hypothetical protein
LSKGYPWYTPYQFAGNMPIWAIDLDGLEEKPTNKGTKEGEPKTTESETKYAPSDCNCPEADGYKSSKVWQWYSGNLNRDAKADWYSQEDYKQITQDWENGQVMQPRDFPKLNRFFNGSENRTWNGNDVNDKGYLTGQPHIKIMGGAGGLEWISGAGEAKALKTLQEAKLLSEAGALLKVGEYTIYNGYKQIGNELRLYIGKAKDGILARYSSTEAANLGAKAFEGLRKVPNNGVALGIEQRVMELNGWGGKGANAAKPVLSNVNNATVKDIYLKAADAWLEKNIPNWKTQFKIQ